jgi:hypothetical protein
MWLIGFLPDGVFYTALLIGLLLIIVSVFLQQFPFISKYNTPILLAGLFLTVVGVWFAGGISKDSEYRERLADMQLEIARAEQRASEANASIEYVYRDRVQVVERIKYEVLGSIREYSTELDSNCQINPKVVEILNRATGASR